MCQSSAARQLVTIHDDCWKDMSECCVLKVKIDFTMSVFNVFCKDILFINFICYLNVNSIEIVVIIIAKKE